MKKILVLLFLLPGYALADLTMPIASFSIGFGDGDKVETSHLTLLGFRSSLNAAEEPKKTSTATIVVLAVVASVAVVLLISGDDEPAQNCRTFIVVRQGDSDTVTRCD